MDVDATCDTFAEADFGHGPVQIRCTKTGNHDQHVCKVWFPLKQEKTTKPDPERTNIFERNKDGHP